MKSGFPSPAADSSSPAEQAADGPGRAESGIPVINASMAYEFDLPETPNRIEPSRKGIRLMQKASQF